MRWDSSGGSLAGVGGPNCAVDNLGRFHKESRKFCSGMTVVSDPVKTSRQERNDEKGPVGWTTEGVAKSRPGELGETVKVGRKRFLCAVVVLLEKKEWNVS